MTVHIFSRVYIFWKQEIYFDSIFSEMNAGKRERDVTEAPDFKRRKRIDRSRWVHLINQWAKIYVFNCVHKEVVLYVYSWVKIQPDH